MNSSQLPDRDISALNQPITVSEVKDAVYRAKARKAAEYDDIHSEVLMNEPCIDLLHKIISASFETGDIPDMWRTGIISPIPKSAKDDPRDPMSYRGLTLLSIPCKVYMSILNSRLCKWLEDNDILVDEQNGFRRNRNCQDHL